MLAYICKLLGVGTLSSPLSYNSFRRVSAVHSYDLLLLRA